MNKRLLSLFFIILLLVTSFSLFGKSIKKSNEAIFGSSSKDIQGKNSSSQTVNFHIEYDNLNDIFYSDGVNSRASTRAGSRVEVRSGNRATVRYGTRAIDISDIRRYVISPNDADYEFWCSILKKVAVGTSIIVVTGTLSTLGGPVGAVFAGALQGAIASSTEAALLGSVIGFAIGVLNDSNDLFKDTLNGAASGYMFGAITGSISGGIKEIKNAAETIEKAKSVGNTKNMSVTESNGQSYSTDSLGRAGTAKGEVSIREGGRTANKALTSQVGKLNGKGGVNGTEQGGHLIADVLGGSTNAYNLVPQNAHINMGIYNQHEQFLVGLAREGHNVYVEVTPVYVGNTYQLDEIVYNYWIDGEKFTRIFPNM